MASTIKATEWHGLKSGKGGYKTADSAGRAARAAVGGQYWSVEHRADGWYWSEDVQVPCYYCGEMTPNVDEREDPREGLIACVDCYPPADPAPTAPAGWDVIEPHADDSNPADCTSACTPTASADRPDRSVKTAEPPRSPVATSGRGIGRSAILDVAMIYNRTYGRPRADLGALPYVKVDPRYHRRIAQAFSAMPDRRADPAVRFCYDELTREVNSQFWILKCAGLRFEPYGDDVPNPYPAGSADVFADIATNGHLFVYNGGEDHAVLTREANWRFRAVHDVFGHYMNGYQFGARGEEHAWRCHRLMFSPAAVLALTSETRGQNSWVNFGPYSDRPVSERPYADQKACILPAFCLELY